VSQLTFGPLLAVGITVPEIIFDLRSIAIKYLKRNLMLPKPTLLKLTCLFREASFELVLLSSKFKAPRFCKKTNRLKPSCVFDITEQKKYYSYDHVY